MLRSLIDHYAKDHWRKLEKFEQEIVIQMIVIAFFFLVLIDARHRKAATKGKA